MALTITRDVTSAGLSATRTSACQACGPHPECAARDPARPPGAHETNVRLRALSRTLIPRLITTSSVVGATTALRVGAGCALLLRRRPGPWVTLAVQASFGRAGPESWAAEATLRDELVALARESAELSWREL